MLGSTDISGISIMLMMFFHALNCIEPTLRLREAIVVIYSNIYYT